MTGPTTPSTGPQGHYFNGAIELQGESYTISFNDKFIAINDERLKLESLQMINILNVLLKSPNKVLSYGDILAGGFFGANSTLNNYASRINTSLQFYPALRIQRIGKHFYIGTPPKDELKKAYADGVKDKTTDVKNKTGDIIDSGVSGVELDTSGDYDSILKRFLQYIITSPLVGLKFDVGQKSIGKRMVGVTQFEVFMRLVLAGERGVAIDTLEKAIDMPSKRLMDEVVDLGDFLGVFGYKLTQKKDTLFLKK